MGVYIGDMGRGSDVTSEPEQTEVELADVNTIKQELEEGSVASLPIEAEDYEPSVLYTFAENSSNAVGKVANSILSVCNDFIDILF